MLGLLFNKATPMDIDPGVILNEPKRILQTSCVPLYVMVNVMKFFKFADINQA